MRIAAAAGLWVGLAAVGTPAAHADALRRIVAPMTRADGEVCDLLRAQAKDKCKQIARDGSASVYQSGTRTADIHRFVIAIDTGRDVLVSPPVDLIGDQIASIQPTLRAVAIDGRPGVVLEVVSTWKPGSAAERTSSLIGCSQADAVWKCSLVVQPAPPFGGAAARGQAPVDAGACQPSVAADGSVTTSCGHSSTLSVASAR